MKRLHGHRRNLLSHGVHSWWCHAEVDDDGSGCEPRYQMRSEHAFAVTNDAARDHHLAHVAPRAEGGYGGTFCVRVCARWRRCRGALRTKGGQRSAGQARRWASRRPLARSASEWATRGSFLSRQNIPRTGIEGRGPGCRCILKFYVVLSSSMRGGGASTYSRTPSSSGAAGR